MGAVYTVYGDLTYKSDEAIVKATKDFINSTTSARFSDTDFTDLDGALVCIFTDRGLDIKSISSTAVKFASDFDASYGWEWVMQSWFNIVAPVLNDGSTLEIYPDSGKDMGIVKNGKVDWGVTDSSSDIYDDDDDDSDDDYEYVDPDTISDPLERCIVAITNYTADEFGHGSIDRNKLDEVGLLYTTATDNDLDVQVSVNLKNPSVTYDVWGYTSDDEEVNISETVKYNSLEDLYDNYLYSLNWDDLYSDVCSYIPDEYYD